MYNFGEQWVRRDRRETWSGLAKELGGFRKELEP